MKLYWCPIVHTCILILNFLILFFHANVLFSLKQKQLSLPNVDDSCKAVGYLLLKALP